MQNHERFCSNVRARGTLSFQNTLFFISLPFVLEIDSCKKTQYFKPNFLSFLNSKLLIDFLQDFSSYLADLTT